MLSFSSIGTLNKGGIGLITLDNEQLYHERFILLTTLPSRIGPPHFTSEKVGPAEVDRVGPKPCIKLENQADMLIGF